MKYVIVIPDGCADEPQETLAGRTPLEAAATPWMDRLAGLGRVGASNNVPLHLPAGSAVANMSLLGYDPEEFFTGRAPLEAAAQGIELGQHDWAVRCNLVTIEDQVMRDFTAGHIETAEARQLLETAGEQLAQHPWQFVPGVSYRNLLLFRGRPGAEAPFSDETLTRPPHDLTDQSVIDDFPRGPGSDVLCDLMTRSADLFADHAVNRKRQGSGLSPATHIWLWGLGRTPKLETFQQRYGKTGQMITAVDLLRGLAVLIGWDRVEVAGATGYLDTDYAAKGRAAIDCLDKSDVVCVHIEAPDEASHEGRVDAKMEALEQIDEKIVGPIYESLVASGVEFRMLISPDHPTPVRTKTHSHGEVPFVVVGQGIAPDSAVAYCENDASRSELKFPRGCQLMNFFLHDELITNN